MSKTKKQIIVVKPQKRKPNSKATKVAKKSGLKSIMKSVGSAVGATYGPLGSRIGSHAAEYISRIMGQGDYKVSKNTLLTNNGPPSFATNGDDVIIKHREFVKDMSSTIAFSNNNYLINPGNATLFPWLSQFATSFEEYEFLGLVVEFKSTSGSAIASTNNALGTVIIATDYNCSNANMTTKRAMETVEFSTSCGTDTNMIHPIECDKTRNVLARQYTTNATSVAAVADPKFHFLGNLQVATVGQQADSIVIGELWVSYQVRLSRPTFESLSFDSPITPAYYYHNNYLLGNWNGLVSGSWTINGLTGKIVTTGVSPEVNIYPEKTTAVTSTVPYTPPGLYQISWIYTLENTGSSSLTYYAPGLVDPYIDLNGHPSGSLIFSLDDNTHGTTTQESIWYDEQPNFVLANTVARWGGSCEVYYKPQLGDTSNSPLKVRLGQYQYTGTTTGTYTCDVRAVYMSPINESKIIKNPKDEVGIEEAITPDSNIIIVDQADTQPLFTKLSNSRFPRINKG